MSSTSSGIQSIVTKRYAYTMWESVFSLHARLSGVEPLNTGDACRAGVFLVDTVFWYTLRHSNRHTLAETAAATMAARALLMFAEFMSLSRAHVVLRESGQFPSIGDGAFFALRKTIGSLPASRTSPSAAHHIVNDALRNNMVKICHLVLETYGHGATWSAAQIDAVWRNLCLPCVLHLVSAEIPAVVFDFAVICAFCGNEGDSSSSAHLTHALLVLNAFFAASKNGGDALVEWLHCYISLKQPEHNEEDEEHKKKEQELEKEKENKHEGNKNAPIPLLLGGNSNPGIHDTLFECTGSEASRSFAAAEELTEAEHILLAAIQRLPRHEQNYMSFLKALAVKMRPVLLSNALCLRNSAQLHRSAATFCDALRNSARTA